MTGNARTARNSPRAGPRISADHPSAHHGVATRRRFARFRALSVIRLQSREEDAGVRQSQANTDRLCQQRPRREHRQRWLGHVPPPCFRLLAGSDSDNHRRAEEQDRRDQAHETDPELEGIEPAEIAQGVQQMGDIVSLGEGDVVKRRPGASRSRAPARRTAPAQIDATSRRNAPARIATIPKASANRPTKRMLVASFEKRTLSSALNSYDSGGVDLGSFGDMTGLLGGASRRVR